MASRSSHAAIFGSMIAIVMIKALHKAVAITFDPPKRVWTQRERGLDFADAEIVFAGPTFDAEDDRRDYGEMRMITVGLLAGRMVVVGWTPRGVDRHVFSMRKANDREERAYRQRLG